MTVGEARGCQSCGAFNSVAVAPVSMVEKRAAYIEAIRERTRKKTAAMQSYQQQQQIGPDGNPVGGDGFSHSIVEGYPQYQQQSSDGSLFGGLVPSAPVVQQQARLVGDDEDEDEDEDDDDRGFHEEEVDDIEVKSLQEIDASEEVLRVSTGDAVFDKVLNGGLPLFTCLMITAQPGTGKSTLCRKAATHLAHHGARVMYASGEERVEKTKSEIRRVGLYKKYPKARNRLKVVKSDDPDAIIKAARKFKIQYLIVDSLMVMRSSRCDGDAGEKLQISYGAEMFMNFAHAMGMFEGEEPVTVVLICHATKKGGMAGPNRAKHWTDGAFIMEHVDPVTLTRIEDQNKPTGYVRLGVHGKYREGPTDVEGFYRMTGDKGLVVHKGVASVDAAAAPSLKVKKTAAKKPVKKAATKTSKKPVKKAAKPVKKAAKPVKKPAKKRT